MALGGNRCHGRHGRPEQVLRAAIAELGRRGLQIERVSRILSTPPLGPSNRRYANAVLKAQWIGSPQALLALLKGLERDFGRRRGLRWGARVLDLDLLAFGNARFSGKGLEVPHPRLASRDFVLQPLEEIAPGWRHPGPGPAMGQTVRHMRARLNQPRPVERMVD